MSDRLASDNAPSLFALLQTARPATLAVALRDGQWLSWRDLQHAIGATLATLQGQPSGRWVLHDSDSFRFAAGLFALLLSGRTPLLPANAQPQTLAELAALADGFLGDLRGVGALPVAEARAVADAATVLPRLPADAAIELMTSGSTGAARCIRKTLHQLDAELDCQLDCWRDHLDQQPLFLASVSHQHIYGLLFRLLLPLRLGAPFAASACDYNEQLYDAVAASRRAVVVTSPAHLRRLPPGLDGAAIAPRLALLLCSGGPLPTEAAHAAEALFGQAPVEMLGSTETGGIAHRCQTSGPNGDARWQPLPGVVVTADADGLLQLRSPWADADASSSDRVEIDRDGRFRLLGRADRVIKVEEKRVSLDAMEQRLLLHPWLAQVRLLVLPDQQRPAAVAVLTEPGARALADTARAALIATLRDHLGASFERSLLPRRWRFVPALPQDAQGKVTQRALQTLFAPAAPGALQAQTPGRCEIAIAPDHYRDHFRGHFPGLPILPGICQLDWAIRHAQQWLLAPAQRFSGFAQVKFVEAIPPGLPLTLQLQQRGDGSVEFHYRCGTLPLSGGRLLFSAEPAA